MMSTPLEMYAIGRLLRLAALNAILGASPNTQAQTTEDADYLRLVARREAELFFRAAPGLFFEAFLDAVFFEAAFLVELFFAPAFLVELSFFADFAAFFAAPLPAPLALVRFLREARDPLAAAVPALISLLKLLLWPPAVSSW
jgi:hypothetical protein